MVLLILAGVSLNLISGSDGILGRTTKVENTHDIETAKEQVDLFVTDILSVYFEEKYANGKNIGSKLDYIKEIVGDGKVIGDYYIILYLDDEIAKVKTSKQIASLNEAYSIAEEGGENETIIEVYRGASSSGTKILEGTIDEEGIITWDKEISQSRTVYTLTYNVNGGVLPEDTNETKSIKDGKKLELYQHQQELDIHFWVGIQQLKMEHK